MGEGRYCLEKNYKSGIGGVADIAKRKMDRSEEDIKIDFGTLSEKQALALEEFRTHKFTCYGGA